ncbi:MULTISPECIES: hypothetical protein [unclassified Pseudomonas]|uniref:hypothetical protein n=1 Tax=unclassified Pseudomonas TaxID=196821 RepID=UPI0015A00706|nr:MULTISPECIES: hypothetical protein [unclassified Pseudomonas]NWC92701.1 hypothetical protein [Pseudomonas sp. IPO3779]NWD17415.1 hypothetical protein [Pseudomonas sp. IPO3778]
MDEIIYQVVNWLSIEHHTRRGTHNNYMVLLYVAVTIGGVVVARELAAKRRALQARTTQALTLAPLTATAFTEDDGQTLKCTGTLHQDADGYTVSITRNSAESQSGLLRSLDEVDTWLRAHTPFILSDFRKHP